MTLTAHSEFGKLKKVFIKDAKDAFISQHELDSGWKSHNFLNDPDYDRCRLESAAFSALLEHEGAVVLSFAQDRKSTRLNSSH